MNHSQIFINMFILFKIVSSIQSQSHSHQLVLTILMLSFLYSHPSIVFVVNQGFQFGNFIFQIRPICLKNILSSLQYSYINVTFECKHEERQYERCSFQIMMMSVLVCWIH